MRIEIDKKELKEGDWVKTEGIFDILNKEGKLASRQTFFRVDKITYDLKDGKERKTYYVKCWVNWAGDIKEGPLPEKIDTLFPLSEEDKRLIILANLK